MAEVEADRILKARVSVADLPLPPQPGLGARPPVLVLVHRGRESGLLHETVVETLLHDPATRESVVLPAWGEKADWYRNVGATPALEIRTGGQRYVPEQRFLAPEEKIAEGESKPIDESGEQTYAFCFRCLSEDRKPCQQ
jgi:deazaflavin-dependent oxidoreductase (nitroreductase family)